MSRAERLYDPDPKVDRTKAPTPQEMRESFEAIAPNLLPDFLGKIQDQEDLPDELKKKVAKARESLSRSLREVGKPALERFERQKGKEGTGDVRVNEHQEERTLPLEDVEAIRRSVASGVERVVKPFLRRVNAQMKVRDRGIRYRSAA